MLQDIICIDFHYYTLNTYDRNPFTLKITPQDASLNNNHVIMMVTIGVLIIIWIVLTYIILKCSKRYKNLRNIDMMQNNAVNNHINNYNNIENVNDQQINTLNSKSNFSKNNLEILNKLLSSNIKGIKYDQSLNFFKVNCTICLENFDSGSYVIKLFCKHIFHYECIKDLMIKNRHNSELKCPNCKNEVLFFSNVEKSMIVTQNPARENNYNIIRNLNPRADNFSILNNNEKFQSDGNPIIIDNANISSYNTNLNENKITYLTDCQNEFGLCKENFSKNHYHCLNICKSDDNRNNIKDKNISKNNNIQESENIDILPFEILNHKENKGDRNHNYNENCKYEKSNKNEDFLKNVSSNIRFENYSQDKNYKKIYYNRKTGNNSNLNNTTLKDIKNPNKNASDSNLSYINSRDEIDFEIKNYKEGEIIQISDFDVCHIENIYYCTCNKVPLNKNPLDHNRTI